CFFRFEDRKQQLVRCSWQLNLPLHFPRGPPRYLCIFLWRQFGFPGGLNNGFPAEVVHELKVSLEEIFHGCTKRMKITRRRLNPDGRSMRTEDKILNIVIKKGWKEGTKITFPKEGDETPENIPADIVFVLKDKGHAHFRRDGSNIIYNFTSSRRWHLIKPAR
uniref:DnaJ heat shock protein family (Hsp40) member B5 n=1 Tax=Nothobranchius furzeri TaxID=105023 RepID=A0A8C6PS32_NOTFU